MHWLVANVVETYPETPSAVTLRLEVPDWPGHRGQHVDVRLTAEDGYSAQRSYSIVSAPDGQRLELTVVRFEDGEVSPYLTTGIEASDQFELRGPIGGYFVWDPADVRPTLLVGGGSGTVPLMAMLRHHARVDHESAMHLVSSYRSRADILYVDELARLESDRRAITTTLTGEPSDSWQGRVGRVDRQMLVDIGWPPSEQPRCFVCGPTPFVEAVASLLVDVGHGPAAIRTERFGPTGG